jgi:hypothetical protein
MVISRQETRLKCGLTEFVYDTRLKQRVCLILPHVTFIYLIV